MNMVVQNDDSNHHSQTEHHRLLCRELAPILPAPQDETKTNNRVRVEFYLYPTVGTVLIYSIKPELTE